MTEQPVTPEIESTESIESTPRTTSLSQRLALARSTQNQEEEGWVSTYMDMITLLLVLFIVLLANSEPRQDKPETETSPEITTIYDNKAANKIDKHDGDIDTDMKTIKASLSDQFDKAGLSEMVEIVESDNSLNIKLSDQILFNSGEAVFLENVDQLMVPIVTLLTTSNYQASIEGHTDNIPINTPRFPSNWELSSARASFVVRYLIKQGIAAHRLRAIGYADSQPLAENNSEMGRRKNRRVTIILTKSDSL